MTFNQPSSDLDLTRISRGVTQDVNDCKEVVCKVGDDEVKFPLEIPFADGLPSIKCFNSFSRIH